MLAVHRDGARMIRTKEVPRLRRHLWRNRPTRTVRPARSFTAPATAQGKTPAPSPAASTMTKQTDPIVFKIGGSGYPSAQHATDSSSNPSGGLRPARQR